VFATASTLVPPPSAESEAAESPQRRKRRLFTDPVWVACASTLVVLDAAVLIPTSSSVWITIMVLVISATLGSYRHRSTLTLSEGDGRYVILTAALVADVEIPDFELPVHSFGEAFAALPETDGLGLLCAFGPEPPSELHALVRACEEDRRRVWVIPRLFDLAPRRDHIWGVAVAIIHRPPIYNPLVRGAKRAIDLGFGLLTRLLLSPVGCCDGRRSTSCPGS
jgi:hypothetical protein